MCATPERRLDTMAQLTLNELPFDIKYQIILHVSDQESLTSLTTTSQDYQDVFHKYEQQILRNIHLVEVQNYTPDSHIFAYCLRCIDQVENLQDLVDIVKEWDLCIQDQNRWPRILDRPKGGYDPKQLLDYLLQDYRGVQRIASAYQHFNRECKQEPGLTKSELERIVQGLYRGWLLVLLFNKRDTLLLEEQAELPDSWDKNFIERVVLRWEFWGVQQIRSVMKELRKMPAGKLHMDRGGGFVQLHRDLEGSEFTQLLNGIQASPDSPNVERTTFLVPFLDYGHVEWVEETGGKYTETYFRLPDLFAEYLLLHTLPNDLAPLYDPHPSNEATVPYNRIAILLSNQARNFAGSEWRRSAPRDLYPQSMSNALTRILKECRIHDPLSQRVVFEGEIQPMRLMEDNMGSSTLLEPYKKLVGQYAWSKSAKLGSCVFDDFRLESRGYVFPRFLEDCEY